MFSDFSIQHASARIKKELRREILITTLISFLPLILGFLAILFAAPEQAVKDGASTSFWSRVFDSIASVFFSGELYFYAMSICASIFIVSQNANQDGNFGMRLWSGVFILFCAGFMAFFIGAGSDGTPESFWFHGAVSIVFLGAATLLYYRVKVLADQPPPAPEDVHRQNAQAVIDASDPNYD